MIVLPAVKHSYIYDAERKSMIIGGQVIDYGNYTLSGIKSGEEL